MLDVVHAHLEAQPGSMLSCKHPRSAAALCPCPCRRQTLYFSLQFTRHILYTVVRKRPRLDFKVGKPQYPALELSLSTLPQGQIATVDTHLSNHLLSWGCGAPARMMTVHKDCRTCPFGTCPY